MKVCPVCQIDFVGAKCRVYCSQKCESKAKYERLKLKMRYPWLMQELSKAGIKRRQIPKRADEEFLSDLLFALQVIRK